jgi:chromosomal replication initiator protein
LERLLCRLEGHAQAFPVLFLHGPPGAGKSHLVGRLLRRITARKPDLTARCIPARDLARLLGAPPQAGPEPGREFRDCDLLIVEDIQHLPLFGSDALASLIDQRQARRGPLVVTASVGPAMLTCLPRRLTSRLSAGLVAGLDPLSPDSRRELARVLCERRRLHVAPEVLDWLARSPSGGARPILGGIHQLERLSRHHPPPLELATVSAELPAAADAPAIERLAEQVAAHFGLTGKQLRGRDRRRCLLWPRQVGMYLARRFTRCSLLQIGASLGGYDHSTVLHSCRRVEERLREDVGLAKTLAELAAFAL